MGLILRRRVCLGRILNFGSLNMDTVYIMDRIVRPGETLPALSVEEFCGGKGFNQSIALSRAGAEVFHAGKIGRDGLMLRDRLLENHVNCRYLGISEHPNGRAIIQKEASGENCIILYGGANREITEEEIDRVLSCFGPGDLLIAQNEISCGSYLLEQAYKQGMEIAWNPSPIDSSLKSVPLEWISLLVINEIEGSELTGQTQPEEILSYFQRHSPRLRVVLTIGSGGSLYTGREGTFRCPAYPVSAVDTTAAGDTFLGYFIAYSRSGASAPDSLKAASAAAALAVTRAGALPSIPCRAKVKRFIKEHSHESTAD